MTISINLNKTKTLESIQNEIKITELEERILKIQEKMRINRDILSKFYAIVLDSHYKLHPHILGNSSTDNAIDLSLDIQEFLQEVKPEEIAQFKECIQKLEQASTYHTKTAHSHTLAEKEEAVQQIHHQIANLVPGESMLLRGQVKDHAFVYQIKKMVNEKYLFTIINTGDDEPLIDLGADPIYINEARKVWLQLDISTRTFDFHKFFKYADKAYLSDVQALNPEFLTCILTSGRNHFVMTEILEHIDQTMTSHGAIQTSGRTHHQQGRGSCSIKSLNSWLKGELINHFGEYRGRVLYAQFKVFRTRKQLEELKRLENGISTEELQELYQVHTLADLQQKQLERTTAVLLVSEKRLRKANGVI